MIKKIFLHNEYIYSRKIYFICNTNILCIKIYLSNDIYIFYIFIYVFLCKNIFSANNVYFVKNKYLKKTIIFFQLSFATNEQPYISAK